MRLSPAFLLPLCASLMTAACRDEGITRARVPKAESAPIIAAMAPQGLERVSGPKGLRWTLPSGWKEVPGTGMRLATFTPPGGIKAEGTVVALPGDTGGELDNANRWRGQIGLPPIDEAGLAAARVTLTTRIGEVKVYDFLSAGEKRTRLIAAVARTGDMTWFFKLTGDEAAANSARAGFMTILNGLAPDAAK